jgi:hypothetical protein
MVITAANGFGGPGRNSQKSISSVIATNATAETMTARTRRARDWPDEDSRFGIRGCDLNLRGSIRFTSAVYRMV